MKDKHLNKEDKLTKETVIMKKVHYAYETFNKAHQLVPQPSEYD